MPFTPAQFLPGLFTEQSAIDSANRYIDGDHVRFYYGFPIKLRGCVKSTSSTFLGICRGLCAWVTLTDKKYIGIGTHLKLYINEGGTYSDITPIRISGTYDPDPISTTDGSTSVTITHVDHGENVGDYITIAGATDVGGLTISGEYTVTTVIDADHFTITANAPATSTATGGGAAVTYAYQIHIGAANTFPLQGWGAGTWGEGTWGTPRTNSGFLQFARTWVVNNFGEDLIASPRDEGIYRWLASTGTSVRAAIVTNAPITNKFVVISPEDRYIIALGAHDGATSDPMLIRWCSQDNITDWTPTTINTAGDKRLSDGNLIMCAVSTRGAIIISTDTTMYQMYPDSEFIFAFKTLGEAGCISPNGMVEYNGIVYIMGRSNFYVYDGTLRILPCDVRTYVFNNLNALQAYKVYGFINSTWNEIWWVYADNNSSECNRYVAYDYAQNIWHYGSWTRTAGIDQGVVNGTPLLTGSNGYLYAHETGVDDDGVPLQSYYSSGKPQEHNRFALIKKMLPNYTNLVGNMSVTFTTQLYPQDSNPVTKGPYTVTNTTNYISPRLRGDEYQITFTSNELGGDYLAGTMELQMIPVGAR
jgi:hypothetical protein